MLGRDYGRENLDDPLGLKVRARATRVGERIFVDGNAAAALGCVYGGATVCAWYPITPIVVARRGVPEVLQQAARRPGDRQEHASRSCRPRTRSPRSAWSSAPAGTARARSRRPPGPGVSLMTEFIGLAYFAEIPVTIIDVQRGGPSTGMPTRTQQADILSCAYASHGDTKHVLLFPEDPHECFEFAAAALDLADRLQTPIFVMTDLDIGMNQRLCEPFAWDDIARLRPRQGDDRRGARGRQGLRPLQRRRRRRHPVAHPARHASEPRARTSRAARRATPTRAIPSAAPTTSTTWSGC